MNHTRCSLAGLCGAPPAARSLSLPRQKQLISAELLGAVICLAAGGRAAGLGQCECGVLADLVVTSLNFAH